MLLSCFETRSRLQKIISSDRARKNEADSRREFPGTRILADLWSGVSVPGKDVVDPIWEVEVTGTEVVVSGKEVVDPGREVEDTGTKVLVFGKEVSVLGKDVVVPGKEVSVPGKGVVEPGGEVVAPEKTDLQGGGRPGGRWCHGWQ